MSMVGFISCFEFVRLFVRISAADLAMMRKTLKSRVSTTEYYEAVESRLCGVEGKKWVPVGEFILGQPRL